MALTTEEILIKIKTEEQGFKRVNDEVKQLESRLNKLSASPKGNVQNFGWFKDQSQTLVNAKTALNQYNTEISKLGTSGVASVSGFTAGLGSMATAWISVTGAQKLWQLSLDSKRFEVLRANFQGAEEDLKNFRTATAGTVTEANLIRLSNQATDLGISLKDQTILFSLAEDAADKYGTSVEEGFQKVVMATEGSAKGLKSIGIQKEIYEKIVNDLAKAHGKNIEDLDAEIQKQIRLEAIIKASGQTFEDATNKIQDSADRQESTWAFLSDAVTKYGWDIAKLAFLPLQAIEQIGGAVYDLKDNWVKLRSVTVDTIKDITAGLIDLRGQANEPIDVKINVTTSVDELTTNFWSVFYGADLRKWSKAKEIEAKGGTRSKPEKTKSGTKKEKEEELNVIKNLTAELEKQKLISQANLGDMFAYLASKEKELEIERKIREARFGKITGEPISWTEWAKGKQWEMIPQRIKSNVIGVGETRDVEEATNTMLSDFQGMVSNTNTMLENMGLMESGMGRIVQLIMGILGGFGQVVSLGESIFKFASNFIPLGRVIGGLGGGGNNDSVMGTGDLVNNFSPSNMNNMQPVLLLQNHIDGITFTAKYVNPAQSYLSGKAV